jgi:AbrB family looped-hinge helix DNA binding protein
MYNNIRISDMTGGTDMEKTLEASGPVVVQVRERGQLTIPAEIRRQMGIKDGDVFSLISLGNTLVATRKRLVAPEIARAIEALMQEEGVSLEELVEGLDEQREIYVNEKYGLDA